MLTLPFLILLSVLALFLGAGFAMMLDRHAWGIAALKGLMASFIGGILFIHLLPEAYHRLGPVSLLYVVLGFLVVLVAERGQHGSGHTHGGRFFTAELLWLGLILHQVADGIALTLATREFVGDWTLAVMVIAHRIPVAAVIIWLYYRQNQPVQAWIRIGAMAVATLVGALFASSLADMISSQWINIAYAMISGSFLHLFTHDFIDFHAHGRSDRNSEFIAFFLGVFLLVLASGQLGGGSESGHHHGVDASFLSTFVILLKETAPYLLLGLVCAGLLHVYMPQSPLNWMGRGSVMTQSAKGMAFGLPLPICSCGVLPLFVSLGKKGMPAAGLIAFLVATPELGIDSFLISLKLLGWKFSLVRLVAAVILPMAIAIIAVKLLGFRNRAAEEVDETKSCCNGPQEKTTWWRFAFVDLVDDIIPLILFGLLVAALAQVLWPVGGIENQVGHWDVLVLGLLGIPFYVCASASVPIALVLLQHGFSFGAVLVFLFAGPATNLSTILSVNKVFGPRSGWKLAGIALTVSLVMGYGINAIYQPSDMGILELHEHGWSWLSASSVLAILVLGLMSMWRSGPLHWISSLLAIIPGIVHHPPIEAESSEMACATGGRE